MDLTKLQIGRHCFRLTALWASVLICSACPGSALAQTATGDVLTEIQRIERQHAPQSQELVQALENLLVGHIQAQRWPEATVVGERVLALKQQLYSREDAEVAKTLSVLGHIYETSGQYAQAIPLFERSLASIENALGPFHEIVAARLLHLAKLYFTSNQPMRALPLTQRSLAIVERSHSPDDPIVGRCLNDMGAIYFATGQYTLALPMYQRSLAIREKAFGPNDIAVAESLNNLALLHKTINQYTLALPMYQRSLEIREKALGPYDVLVAESLSNLGGVYASTGQYALALSLAQRSLAITEKALGSDHLAVALGLNNLAAQYGFIGQYAQAVPLLERSLAIYEKAFGPDHPRTVETLGNLAFLYFTMGKYAQALSLNQRSLAITEKNLPPEHPDVAFSLNNLATIYLALDQHTQALPLYQRSLAITENALGPGHADMVRVLNNLAVLYTTTGQYALALPLFQRSLAIAEGNPGAIEAHWTTLANLAALYEEQDQTEASILMGKLAVNRLQELRDMNRKAGIHANTAYLDTRRWVYTRLVTQLLAQGRFSEAETVLQMQRERELYEDVTRGGDQLQPTQRAVPLSADQEAQLQALQRSTLAYAKQMQEFKELSDRQSQPTFSAADRARLTELTRLVTGLSADLKRFWGGLSQALALRSSSRVPPDAKTAQTDLSRLVAEATRRNPDAPVVALQYVVTPKELVIVVTARDLPQPLRLVQPIVSKDEDLRQLASKFNVAISGAGGASARVRELGAQLHKLLIEPVRPLLQQLKARTVLLWTTDVLRLVPFAALYDGQRYLVEEGFDLVQYNDLNVPLPGPWAGGERSMAAFGLSHAVAGPPARPALLNVPSELKGVARYWPSSTRWLDSEPLAPDVQGPFTLSTLDRALQAGVAGQYQLLHLASHFQMVAGRPDLSALSLGDGSVLTLKDLQDKSLRFKGFDLVTLSACSTARSEGLDFATGQEMQSLSSVVLRRGARSVVATLWDVATTSTGALMERFYERLKAGRNKAQALREAQLALLRPDAPGGLRPPEELRKKGVDWQHPYYWAPMVLSGEWR